MALTGEDAKRSPAAAAPLQGRRALLTGSVSGLGLAMAEGLARAGCDVMLNGLQPEDEGEMVSRTLSDRTGAKIGYQQADVATLEGVQDLLDTTRTRFGGIDILVNNAVVRHFAPITEFPAERWDAALAVNLSAAFHAIRLALPDMRHRNFGRIFNVTSVYGTRGTTNRVDYVTTKSALLGLTRSVALENLEYDVTCHALCPGSVLTPGTEARVTELMENNDIDRSAAERQFLYGKQPGARFISPDSVTALLVFLCGSVARDMTGALVPVEAGWLAS